MTKEELYKKMDINEDDIQKGQALFKSLSPEMRKEFLSDIYAEYQPSGFFKSLYYIYGEFPKFRKVALVNFVFEGSDEEKQRLAWGLSNPYDNEKIEDLFHITYLWINETNDSKTFESLSRGLLFYLDRVEVIKFLEKYINHKLEFAKGVFSWLYIQPDWFRKKFNEQEIKIWRRLQDRWPEILTDEFKCREINKSLGISINNNEVWLHEVENPWNFSDDLLNKLSESGIDIKTEGYIGEFAMRSPLITGLILNGKRIEKSIGGPFVVDNNNKFLCCTTFSREEGFTLVLINLKTNKIIELSRNRSTYSPYKFENGEFIIIVGDKKIDLEKDTIRYKLNELEQLTD